MKFDSTVFVARSPGAAYGPVEGIHYPELPFERRITTSLVTLRRLLVSTGWDIGHLNDSGWNPLSALVPPGARVLVKPNWVRHPNPKHEDGQSLVTHTDVIDALLVYLGKVPGCRVVIGDAPIQGCDFERLKAANGIPDLLARHASRFDSLSVVDFRKTVLGRPGKDGRVQRDCRSDAHFVLFDLGPDSLLEPVTTQESRFRVTVYNPDHLARTHRSGRHQYLVAKEVLEAEVVFSLPKLKTHKKACLTGALKNMVGINGHKEYLPHHRLGGSGAGGDCYAGRNWLKALAEHVLDLGNRTERLRYMRLSALIASGLIRLNQWVGGDDNLEGSWYGNDTVWRMCLDLQKILYYGKLDGTLASKPQRRVVTLTDAIIAGQGEGPLQPTPCPLGLMTLGESTAAVELVHCFLLGLDPRKIPLIREAFRQDKWPLVNGGMDTVTVCLGEERLTPELAGKRLGTRAIPPRGWRGHCEWEEYSAKG